MHIDHWHYTGRRSLTRKCCRCGVVQVKQRVHIPPPSRGLFCQKLRGKMVEHWETVAPDQLGLYRNRYGTISRGV